MANTIYNKKISLKLENMVLISWKAPIFYDCEVITGTLSSMSIVVVNWMSVCKWSILSWKAESTFSVDNS